MTVEPRYQVVATVYEAIAERDLDRCLTLIHPDWRFEVDTDAVTGDTRYAGHAGLRRWFEQITELEGFITKPRDMVIHEGRVAVLSVTSVRDQTGGEISILGLSFWHVDADGLVRSIEGVTEPDRVQEWLRRLPFRR